MVPSKFGRNTPKPFSCVSFFLIEFLFFFGMFYNMIVVNTWTVACRNWEGGFYGFSLMSMFRYTWVCVGCGCTYCALFGLFLLLLSVMSFEKFLFVQILPLGLLIFKGNLEFSFQYEVTFNLVLCFLMQPKLTHSFFHWLFPSLYPFPFLFLKE